MTDKREISPSEKISVEAVVMRTLLSDEFRDESKLKKHFCKILRHWSRKLTTKPKSTRLNRMLRHSYYAIEFLPIALARKEPINTNPKHNLPTSWLTRD